MHPVLAQALGALGDQRPAGRAELGTRAGPELVQAFGGAALGIHIGPGASRRVDLGPPVQIREERVGGDRLLRSRTAAVAGHVARADRDQVRRRAELGHRLGDAHRAHQVDLDRAVERRVERHGRGRVDHHVGLGQRGPSVVVEAEPVGADVAADRPDPRRHLGEAVGSELAAQPVEAVVAQHLALQAPLGGGAATVADQQRELHVGHAAQQSLDQRGADEAGRAGDEDPRAGQTVDDHGRFTSRQGAALADPGRRDRASARRPEGAAMLIVRSRSGSGGRGAPAPGGPARRSAAGTPVPTPATASGTSRSG